MAGDPGDAGPLGRRFLSVDQGAHPAPLNFRYPWWTETLFLLLLTFKSEISKDLGSAGVGWRRWNAEATLEVRAGTIPRGFPKDKSGAEGTRARKLAR